VTLAIQILIIFVLIATLFAVLRLYFVLGNVRQTLKNLETTRTEISSTLQRLESVAQTTQRVLDEEVAPTLRVARDTLVNVEVTTRALAETTQAIRRLTGKAEGVVQAQQLIKVGGPLLQQVAKRSMGVVGSLFAGIGAGMRSMLARRKQAPQPAPPEPEERDEIIVQPKSLPASDGGKALKATPKAQPKSVAAGGKKR